MDYGTTSDEQHVIDWVGSVVADHGGLEQLRGGAKEPEIAELDATLTGSFASGARLHLRALVVEEAARLGLPAAPGPTLLVGREVLDPAHPDIVAVADRGRRGPVRLPGHARLLLTFDRDEVRLADIDPSRVKPVPSSFGYPYAEVADHPGTVLPGVDPSRVRALWYLCLATELAGTARAAVALAAAHLRTRTQFGQRLSDFQALRHRLSELAVSTEAAVWLAREAAASADARQAGTAVLYARNLAAKMAPEMVQLSGARGFTLEFPLHLFAMRAEALRLELGSGDRLARELWDDRLLRTGG